MRRLSGRWLLAGCGENLGWAGGGSELRAGIRVNSAEESERQGPVVARGPTSGGHFANWLLFGKQFSAGGWDFFPCELHAHEQPVDVPEGVNSGNRFLPQVAPLGEADGLLVPADFLREVVVRDVDAEEGKA